MDFRCTDVSTTIDSSLTMVMGDDMVKVVAWYDNEWGYRWASLLPFLVPMGSGQDFLHESDSTQQL